MNQSTLKFTDAYNAWMQWNLYDFHERAAILSNAENINGFEFAHQHALPLLSSPKSLVGPTGETNELYTAGRGVAVILIDQQTASITPAVLVHLFTALLAGNSVIICCDEEIEAQLNKQLAERSLPSGVLQFVSIEHAQLILTCDIAITTIFGTQETLNQAQIQLSSAENAIVTIIYEHDLTHFPVTNDPKLALRYITERTRTINVTAVGGNATLLELGADSH